MTRSNRTPAVVLGALALAIAAFFVWMAARPPAAGVARPPAAPAVAMAAAVVVPAAAPSAAGTAPAAHAIDVALVDGKPSGGDETFKVRQGENVDLRIASDRPVVLHLHGYDIEARGGPGAPARFSFVAAIPGRFAMSEHRGGGRHHRAVLYLEVHP